MKLFLRKILIRVLQPFGFYITYYASPTRVYESLSKLPVLIREYELKRIFDMVGIAKNHKFHNALLAKFIPTSKLEIKDAKFIGFGAGESSLSTFRKVKIEDKTIHEKIYFSSHQDLKRISWFYQNVSHLVQDSGIALPNIYKIYSGDSITVLYTEYAELKKLDIINKKKSLLQFSKQLYQLSLTEEFEIINGKASNAIKDFKGHFEYKRNRSVAKHVLYEHGFSLEAIEQKIMQSRYVLTHGDIQDTNAFQNNILIDWDSVGIFPVGLDPAFLLFYLMMNDNDEKFDILNWIDTHYKKLIIENEWGSFQLNVLYFLFVFIQKRIKKEKHEVLNKELIRLLKNVSSNRTFYF
jgi:thiamine kinase-like enzyme